MDYDYCEGCNPDYGQCIGCQYSQEVIDWEANQDAMIDALPEDHLIKKELPKARPQLILIKGGK